MIAAWILTCLIGSAHSARITRVVDGDTFDAVIDLDLGVTAKRRIRLFGVDAPEVVGVDRPRGIRAKEFVEKIVAENPNDVRICTRGVDSFGRVLADVIVADHDIAASLRLGGHIK